MSDQETFQAQFLAELQNLRHRVSQLEALKNGVTPTITSQTLSNTASTSNTRQRIFVSIASYCDPDLPRTLEDCLSNAQYPERLRFGICWQYDVQHPVDVTSFQRDPRFRFLNYRIEESQGGTWARSMAQRFWDGEAYTLQVDSHMKFEPAWDETLIRMIQSFPSDKPLITVNVPLFWYDPQGHLQRQTDLGIRTTRVNGWDGIDGWAPWFDWGKPNTRNPGRNRFISGGFVFTLGKWNTEVPQDPEHYYWGEEFSLTVRSYTHGYDLFLPQEIVAWHQMHAIPPRRHGDNEHEVVEQKNRIAFERLSWLLYSKDADAHRQLGPYGIGQQRSIRDYEIYAGMNFRDKTAHPDVFTGETPDPVTIKTEQDWEHCLSFEAYERKQASATDVSIGSGNRQWSVAEQTQPISETVPSSSTRPRIFVSIASYCDPDLPRTLEDCLSNAQYPDRLRFGICWQYDDHNPVDVSTFQRDPRFRFLNYRIEESQGGTWARSMAQRFWDGEVYTLQVDSHMKFEPAWDETLIRMIQSLPSDKPLITVNAPLFWYDAHGRLHRQTYLGIRTTRVNSWGPSDGWAPWFDWGSPNTRSPGRNRFISGNFVFTLGKWNIEVPQDPEHYYHGEELNLTVRSFTHGYDFFLPQKIVAWHQMHPIPPRRHWENGQEVVQEKNRVAFERLRWLLYSDEADAHRQLGPYGIGQQRSIRDYEIYAGMDFRNKTAHPDVFTGETPDPVTIKTEQDWEHCLTFEEFNRLHEPASDVSIGTD